MFSAKSRFPVASEDLMSVHANINVDSNVMQLMAPVMSALETPTVSVKKGHTQPDFG